MIGSSKISSQGLFFILLSDYKYSSGIDGAVFLDTLASLKTTLDINSDTDVFKITRFQEYYRVIQIIIEYNRVLQSVTEYYRVLQSITE